MSNSAKSQGIPDLRWINRNVSVAEAAHALDLQFDGASKIHCWHPERHKSGDRTASVGIRRGNNTVKCFGCDSKPMGPVDLVMNVLDLNGPADAALWIAERFSVPFIPKGKHLKQPSRPQVRAGFEGDIGILVMSGLWAEFSAPTRCIVPALLSLADWESGKRTAVISISYEGISRYSGVASPNAIAKAIRGLEEIGWLTRKKAQQSTTDPLRAVGVYLLTPQADSVVELAAARWRQTREAIEGEREIRRRKRAERRTALFQNSSNPRAAGACTKYKPLYPSNSVSEIAAIRRIAGIWQSDSGTQWPPTRRRRRSARPGCPRDARGDIMPEGLAIAPRAASERREQAERCLWTATGRSESGTLR
jgi:DNA-binding PadR family transcriptional regulator